MGSKRSGGNLLFILILFWPHLIGCSQSGPERAIVTGRVTFESQPIEKGFIRFFPIKGTEGPMWGAQIRNGQYSAHGKGGVPVGTLRVEIEATRPVKNAPQPADLFEDFGDGQAAVAEVQYIPAKYNKQSILELVIPPGSDEVTQDFELFSR